MYLFDEKARADVYQHALSICELAADVEGVGQGNEDRVLRCMCGFPLAERVPLCSFKRGMSAAERRCAGAS